MSYYCRQKALRVPVSEEDLQLWGVKSLYELEDKLSDLFSEKKGVPRFEVAPTTECFIDYLLVDEEGYDEYGKTRALSENEKAKYRSVFQKVLPNVDMDKVRLVDYCWYNCCEAPNYYDETNDDFYDEV